MIFKGVYFGVDICAAAADCRVLGWWSKYVKCVVSVKVDGSVDLFVGRGVGDEIGRVFGDELALGFGDEVGKQV